MLLELLEQLDRFLRCRTDRLVLVHSAYVQDWQQVIDMARDLILEVCSDRIQRIDGYSLGLSVF